MKNFHVIHIINSTYSCFDIDCEVDDRFYDLRVLFWNIFIPIHLFNLLKEVSDRQSFFSLCRVHFESSIFDLLSEVQKSENFK